MEKSNDMKATEYIESVTVGHGGGITGATTQYTIKGDGQVTKTHGMPSSKMDTTLMSKLSAERLKQVHEGLDSLKLKEISFNYPGNMSWFIAIEVEDSLQNRITWGVPNEKKVDEAVKKYHNTLLEWVQEMENEKQ